VINSLSFSEFMEQALYDPQHGYYASGRARIGKAGDFFTNVSVGKIYGKILALFFEELWKKMGRPKNFTVVEQGANDGRLALDILEASKASLDFFSAIRYSIVEPFSIYQKKQQETLKDQKNISWVQNLKTLPAFEGIHFSNELLDAFPIDLLMWDGKEWLEKRVVTKGSVPDIAYSGASPLVHAMAPKYAISGTDPYSEGSSWTIAPIEQKELRAVAEKLPTTLAPGFLWEVRLGIRPWLEQLAMKLERGMILIADYGYAGPQRFAPYRAQGSMACYQDHRRYDNPLEEIGKRDITAHVDFTDLADQASNQCFEILGYTDQHHFLIGAAEIWLRTFEGKSLMPHEQKEFRLLQTLLHPETMGRAFQFLSLGKNLHLPSPLSGFHYQRPGVDYLFAT